MRGEHRDPYVVLGVSRQASASEIARAYRRAARATHPDSSGGGSSDGFRTVNDAYETLRDPRQRAAYDRAHPPVRAGDPAEPSGPDIVLGPPASAAPFVRAGKVEIVPPAGALRSERHAGDDAALLLARLVLSLLRPGW